MWSECLFFHANGENQRNITGAGKSKSQIERRPVELELRSNNEMEVGELALRFFRFYGWESACAGRVLCASLGIVV